MKLRCVGGANDGDWIDLPAGPQSIVRQKPVKKVPAFDVSATKAPEAEIETVVTLYTVRIVKADGAEAIFLAPDGWSSIRAINHLLDK